MRWGLFAIGLSVGLLAVGGCTTDFPPLGPLPDGGADQGPASVDGGNPAPDRGLDAAVADRGPVDPDAATDALPPDLGGGGGEDASVPDQALPPDAGTLCGPETCNMQDDDCDGQIDENFPLVGEPCVVGLGACRREGQQVCAGNAVVCNAEQITGQAESCDGRDNDCDGSVDEAEAFQGDCELPCGGVGDRVCQDGLLRCLGEDNEPQQELCFNNLDDDCDGAVDEQPDGDCVVGQGLCAQPGILDCALADDAGRPGCFGEPGPMEVEICDGLDNDCNGQVDEAEDFNGVCQAGLGACRQEGELLCPEGGGALICNATPLPPAAVDRCDGIDNDCDGGVDEDWRVGRPCSVGVGGCAASGTWRCTELGDEFCDAAPGAPSPESCNGVDDDCDGRIDEGQPGGQSPCGDWIAGHCRIWLGWVDSIQDPNALGAIPTWGDCPGSGRSIRSNVACVNSGSNQRFQSVSISGGMDDNDWLSVRFECEANGAGPWIDRNCQVALAYGDVASRESLQRLDPRQCPTVAPRTGANPRCVRSGGDRLFHPVQTQGRVNTDDGFGITFFCGGDDPERAQWVESSVEVFLGLYNRDTWFDGCWHNEINNDSEWGDCWQDFRDNGGRARCVGATGGRGFDGISPDWEVSRCDQFGVSLRRAR